MSQDDDFDLFQQMMGDVKPIDQDTANHKKVHHVTDAQMAKREARFGSLKMILNTCRLTMQKCSNLMTLSSSNEMVYKMAYTANYAW